MNTTADVSKYSYKISQTGKASEIWDNFGILRMNGISSNTTYEQAQVIVHTTDFKRNFLYLLSD